MKRDGVSGLSYSVYSLRHTYITHRLLAGVTSDIIASQCGTSVKMIERTYSSVVPLLAKNKVVGTRLGRIQNIECQFQSTVWEV